MAKVERLKDVIAKIKARARKWGPPGKVSATVGFTQGYGVIVHEDMEASHGVGGPKFLENAARTKRREVSTTIADSMKSGNSLEDSLVLGGLIIQRDAQENTPVDTSALKNSAFTAKQKDEEAAAQAAFMRSEAIRQAAKAAKTKRKT